MSDAATTLTDEINRTIRYAEQLRHSGAELSEDQMAAIETLACLIDGTIHPDDVDPDMRHELVVEFGAEGVEQIFVDARAKAAAASLNTPRQ